MTLLHDKVTRTTTPDGATTTRAGRRAGRTVGGERASRSALAQRAIDRRQRRIARGGESVVTRAIRNRRVPFVVPIIVVLVAGLGLSLWLSTKAAQDSYRLGVVRSENQSLSDRVDTLKQTFESGDSAAALSDKAGKLGMIPSDNPPRMIVGADGKRRVVGQVSPAEGRSLPSINDTGKAEDPLAKIDKSKVDDSNGLGGDQIQTDQTQAGQNQAGQDQNGPDGTDQTRAPQADTDRPVQNQNQNAPSDQSGRAADSPDSAGTQANSRASTQPSQAPTQTPAPNVLPTESNPPGGNSGQPR